MIVLEEFSNFITYFDRSSGYVKYTYKLLENNNIIYNKDNNELIIIKNNVLVNKLCFSSREFIVDYFGDVVFKDYELDERFVVACFKKKVFMKGEKCFELPLPFEINKCFKLWDGNGLFMQFDDYRMGVLYHPLQELKKVKRSKDEPIEFTMKNEKVVYVDKNFPIILVLSSNSLNDSSSFNYIFYELNRNENNSFSIKNLMEVKLNIRKVYVLCKTIDNSYVIYILCNDNSLYCFLDLKRKTFLKIENVKSIAQIRMLDSNVIIALNGGNDKNPTFSVFYKQYRMFNFRIANPNNFQVRKISYPIENSFHIFFKNGIVNRFNINQVLPKDELLLRTLKVLERFIPFELYSQLFFDFIQQSYLNSFDVELEWEIFERIIIYLFNPSIIENLEQKRKSKKFKKKNYWQLLNKKKEIFFNEQIVITNKANLITQLSNILFSLHLLYENYKLSVIKGGNLLFKLASLLSKISSFLGWEKYLDYYKRDFPFFLNNEKIITKKHIFWSYSGNDINFCDNYNSTNNPPSIFRYINGILSNKQSSIGERYPIIKECEETNLSRIICRIFHVFVMKGIDLYAKVPNSMINNVINCFQRVLFVLIEENFFNFNTNLQFCISLFLKQCGIALRKSNFHYNCNWMTEEAFNFLGRDDLKKLVEKVDKRKKRIEQQELWTYFDFDDKRENIKSIFDADLYYGDINRWKKPDRNLGYRVFSEDRRLDEVWKRISNTTPLSLDAEYKKKLVVGGSFEQKLIIHIFSLSIGRGMVKLCTRTVTMTDTLNIPDISICAVIQKERNKQLIDLSKHLPEPDTETQSIKVWPTFHCAVSETLSIVALNGDPHNQTITREWILFQREKKATVKHAGMLLGLGLLRHLNVLVRADIYSYLSAQHNLTTIALLLGISVSKMGTQSSIVTRALSVHMTSLTPNSNVQLSCDVQSAASVGLGFVYLSSAHRFFSEVLFAEIIRPPIDEHNNRDGYCLAAGIGFGLINLGRGTSSGPPSTLVDMNINEVLFKFIEGGKYPFDVKEFIPSAYYTESLLLLQRKDQINKHIIAPSCIYALTLMYIMSNNESVASRMSVPSKSYDLQFLTPEILLLKIISTNLIMWDSITPTEEWIESQIPQGTRKALTDNRLDWLMILYIHSICGACFSLGLKYAGSGRDDVYELLMNYLQKVNELAEDFSSDRVNFDYVSINIICAMSFIVAGRGKHDLFKIIQNLREQQAGNFSVQFGCSMAEGMNFLGAGRLTLKTTPLAVACLFISFSPKFPTTIVDQKFHLQAFRHLYVIATEPRLLEAIDVETNKSCFVPIKIVCTRPKVINKNINKNNQDKMVDDTDSEDYEDRDGDDIIEEYSTTLPALIPERKYIKMIQIVSERYYDIEIESENLNTILNNLILFVKKKSSYTPTLERKDVIKESNNNTNKYNVKSIGDRNVKLFCNEKNEYIFTLFDHFKKNVKDFRGDDLLIKSIEIDNSELIIDNLLIEESIKKCGFDMNSMWNLKIIQSLYNEHIFKQNVESIFDSLYIEYIRLKVQEKFNNNDFLKFIDSYLKGGNIYSKEFGCFLEYFEIPLWNDLFNMLIDIKKKSSKFSIPFIIQKLPKLTFKLLQGFEKFILQ